MIFKSNRPNRFDSLNTLIVARDGWKPYLLRHLSATGDNTIYIKPFLGRTAEFPFRETDTLLELMRKIEQYGFETVEYLRC